VDDLESIERAISALEQQRELLGPAVVATALQPLIEKRAALRERQHGEQRKIVTVLFADLVGFTVLSQQLDPEDTRAVVNAYFARWQGQVEAHGGVVEKFIGDAVMAVFGLYQAKEDDPHAAIRASLSMRDTLGELNAELNERYGIELSMRIGIDTGEVVVSTLGERPGHEFVVVGESVNRASRLQSASPSDGILISADTYRHVRGVFGFQPMRGLHLKGIDAPVDAYLVLAERPRTFRLDGSRGVEGIETTTVGRESEMRRLVDRLHDVTDERRWQVVTIFGEAGVGKTRLLLDFDRWLAEAPDPVWWFRGRASLATQNQPGSLLRDALTARFGINESDVPAEVRRKCRHGFAAALGENAASAAKADLVGFWLGLELGDDVRSAAERIDPPLLRGRAMTALGEYFVQLSHRAPVVILLEDLHWADDVSLGCLDAADSVLGDTRVLVVATARPSLLERRPLWGEGLVHHSRLYLEPLSRRESRALLAQLLARVDEVPSTLTDVVVEAAEGNPFYIEELVRYFIDSGVILRDDDHWRILEHRVVETRVPMTLKGLLQARIDALPAAERDILQRASVVGRVFWDKAVEHLAAADAAALSPEEFDGLRHREVIYERELPAFDDTREFLFKHALVRDVTYDGLLRSRRRGYHQLTATWLERVSERSNRVDEYAALIADHLDRAASPTAASWYLRAGRQAAAVHALAEAGRLLDRGLELVRDDDGALRFDLLATREGLMDWAGERDAQEADLDAMAATAEQVDDPDRRITLLLAQARWAFVHSDYELAVARGGEAADIAASSGLVAREAEAQLMAGQGLTWWAHHDEAEAVLGRALVNARAAAQLKIVGETLRYLSMVALNQADFETALELLEQAREVATANRDTDSLSSVLAQFSAVYYYVGRLDEAREHLERTLPIFRESGNRYREAAAVGNLAGIAVRQGQLDFARQRATESLTMTERLNDLEGQITANALLGEVCLALGEFDEAQEHFARAVTLAEGIESRAPLSDTLILSTIVALEQQDLERAQAIVARAEVAAEATGSALAESLAALTRGYVAVAAGVWDDAATALARAREGFAQLNVVPQEREAQAMAALVAIRSGRTSDAIDAIRPVVEHLSAAGLAGTLRPHAVLRACWAVLDEAKDGQAADVAARARAYVDERAALIRDEQMRKTYSSSRDAVELRQLGATTDDT
jgi:class 3 adenylate cyclase/tetratricopeptide (TPR) repeat protein